MDVRWRKWKVKVGEVDEEEGGGGCGGRSG